MTSFSSTSSTVACPKKRGCLSFEEAFDKSDNLKSVFYKGLKVRRYCLNIRPDMDNAKKDEIIDKSYDVIKRAIQLKEYIPIFSTEEKAFRENISKNPYLTRFGKQLYLHSSSSFLMNPKSLLIDPQSGLILDPVICDQGHVVERSAVQKLKDSNGQATGFCNCPEGDGHTLRDTDFYENPVLSAEAQQIQESLATHAVISSEFNSLMGAKESSIVALQEEHYRKQSRINELERANSCLKQELTTNRVIESAEGHISLTSRIQALEEDNEGLLIENQMLAQLSQNVKIRMEEEQRKVNKELIGQNRELTERLAAKKITTAILRDKWRGQRKELAAQRIANAVLLHDWRDKTREIHNLSSQLQNLTGQVSNLTGQMSQMLNIMQELKHTNERLFQENTSFQGRLDQQNQEFENRLDQQERTHNAAITQLRDEHTASLATMQSAHNQHIATLRDEHTAAMTTAVTNLQDAHATAMATMQSTHNQDIATLRDEHTAAMTTAVTNLQDAHATAMTTAVTNLQDAHATAMATMEATLQATHATAMATMQSTHNQDIATLRDEHTAAMATMQSTHNQDIATLRDEHTAAMTTAVTNLQDAHATAMTTAVTNLQDAHATAMATMEATLQATHATAMATMQSTHNQDIATLRDEHTAAMTTAVTNLQDAHATAMATMEATHNQDIATLRDEHTAAMTTAVTNLQDAHATAMATMEATHNQDIATLRDEHTAAMTTAVTNLQDAHATAMATMQSTHNQDIASLRDEHTTAMTTAVTTLQATHATAMATMEATHSAAIIELQDERATLVVAMKATHDKDKGKLAERMSLLETEQKSRNDVIIKLNEIIESQSKSLDSILGFDKLRKKAEALGERLSEEANNFRKEADSLNSEKTNKKTDLYTDLTLKVKYEIAIALENLKIEASKNIFEKIKNVMPLNKEHVNELENAVDQIVQKCKEEEKKLKENSLELGKLLSKCITIETKLKSYEAKPQAKNTQAAKVIREELQKEVLSHLGREDYTSGKIKELTKDIKGVVDKSNDKAKIYMDVSLEDVFPGIVSGGILGAVTEAGTTAYLGSNTGIVAGSVAGAGLAAAGGAVLVTGAAAAYIYHVRQAERSKTDNK